MSLRKSSIEKTNNNRDKSREVDADGMVTRKPPHNVIPIGMSSYQFVLSFF